MLGIGRCRGGIGVGAVCPDGRDTCILAFRAGHGSSVHNA